ncbi:MAG: metalloregulator ArsR/SmtB family transcription factor [Salibacteraceae bacterium]
MGTTRTDLFTEKQNNLSSMFKALAHPARIAIVEHLIKSKSCINSDLVNELGLAQATVSQHLRELKEAGIIKGEIEGVRRCYCINPDTWSNIQSELNAFFSQYSANDSSECCDEVNKN